MSQLHPAYCCSPTGHYCPGGTSGAVQCSPGSYQDETGQGDCKPCPTYSFSYFPGATGCIAW